MTYLPNKTTSTLITLLGVATTIFFPFNILPGNTARIMLNQHNGNQQPAAVKHKYRFDKPITIQYLYYLNDLSPISTHPKNPQNHTFLKPEKYNATPLFSTKHNTITIKSPYPRTPFTKQGEKVSHILKETLPNTITLALSAITIALLLRIHPLAVITQPMRNTPLNVLAQDYIRTARAKSLLKYQVVKKHALNPLVTATSRWFAPMLAGAAFIKYIFSWNRLGKELVNTLDLPIVMGAVLIIPFLFITINTLVDITYT